MSLLVKIETKDLTDGVHKTPPADRVIEGDPRSVVWNQDFSNSRHVRSGVADLTAGTTRSMKGTDCEVIHVVEGVVELTEDGGESQTFRAGDIFVMKPGFVGTWKSLGDVRKAFTLITQQPK